MSGLPGSYCTAVQHPFVCSHCVSMLGLVSVYSYYEQHMTTMFALRSTLISLRVLCFSINFITQCAFYSPFKLFYNPLKTRCNNLSSNGGGGRLGPVISGSPVGGTGTGIGSNVPVVGVGGGSSLSGGSLDNLLGGSLLSSLLGVLGLFGISVEVEIGHDGPLGVSVLKSATESQHLSREHPPDKTDRVSTLVVAGDGNVDKLNGRVGVAQSNDGDVDVRGLLDGLVVGSGIGDNQKSGLLERSGDVVGERSGGESAGNGGGATVVGKLEHGSLSVGSGRDGDDISGVGDGGDDSGGQLDLLPGLANVDDVHTISSLLENVRDVLDLC